MMQVLSVIPSAHSPQIASPRHPRVFPLWTAVVALLLLAIFPINTGCAEPPSGPVRFEDDLDLRDLDVALARSLAALRAIAPATRYAVGGKTVPVGQLITSVLHLQALLANRPSVDALADLIGQDFEVLRVDPSGAPPRRMLITGYYQPLFAGSLHRRPPFIHPLYRVPEDLVIQPANGKLQVRGRLQEDVLVPYWTRRQIEQDNLLQGRELAWLRDPFDAFTLHVQGSGLIRLPDGSLRGVRYAQKNGHPYRSIGTFLADTGRMRRADITLASIRGYLADHPEERETILHHNDSFIFFQLSNPGPPVGSLGHELTPGRSLAADHRHYPPGSLLFLESRRPLVEGDRVREWRPMRRFVTVHDTGSAITGPGRLDVYWGTGDQAGQEAGQMKEDGVAYLLLRKDNSQK